MEYLPFVLIALLAAFMLTMPLLAWLGSKRLQGSAAPPFDDLLGPAQGGFDRYLFYFTSAHCGPCRALTPLVDAAAQRHRNVVKVDVMRQMAAAQRFGVRATPTLVLVEQGRVAKVILGSVSARQLDLLLGKKG